MPLTLQTIDGCAAEVGDRWVVPSAEIRFAGLLVLGFERGRRLSRHDLGALLWPHASPVRRAARLRWLLHRYRAMGLEVRASRVEVLVPRSSVVIDSDGLTDRPLEAIGPILPGYAPRISPQFEQRLERWREETGSVVLRHLAQRLPVALAQDDWATSAAICAAMLRVDATNEEATLRMAEAHCRSGSKALALALLDRYLETLGADRGELRLPADLLRRRIEAASSTSEGSGEPPFVGRGEQLARIDALVRGAVSRRGSALVLSGPSGIGKSRLLAEAAAHARYHRVRVLGTGARGCSAGVIASPLDLALHLLNLPGAAGIAPEHLATLRTHVERSTSYTSSPPAAFMPALLDLLDATSAEAPLLITIDDADEFVRAAVPVWSELRRWSDTRAVAWLLAVRADNVARAIEAAHIPVGALDVESASTLVNELAVRAGRPLAVERRTALLDRAAGHPLLLCALFAHSANGSLSAGAPPHVSVRLEEMLDRMQPHALAVLQAAGILGSGATLERLERTAALEAGDFFSAVAALEADGALTTDSEGVARGHMLFAEAALRRLSRHLTRLLHLRAAHALHLELADDAPPTILSACAAHWEAAGNHQRALAITRQALASEKLTPPAARERGPSATLGASDPGRRPVLSG